MIGTCRTCLLRKSKLVSLADSRTGTPILDMLASVCGLHLQESPWLLHVVCERCLAKLELAHAVAQEFRNQEMLLRSMMLADGGLVRLEQYQTMVREEPRSERLVRDLNASFGLEKKEEEETEMTIEDRREIELTAPPTEVVVKEELIIVDNLNMLCENEATVMDAVLENDLQDNRLDEELPTDGRYQCNECPRQFSSLCVYRNHRRKHEQIRQHIGTQSNEQKRTCAHCKREFTDLRSFHGHVAWHNRKGLLCCSYCGENQVTPESFRCHICPMGSNQAKKLPARVRYQYRCEECGKKFSLKKYYQIHRERHENIRKGTFKCDICFKCLAGKVSLRKHMREHTGKLKVLPEFMKTCEECGKQLPGTNAYQCHVYRHRKDKNGPYHCSKCGKNFATRPRLTNHICNAREQSKEAQACSEPTLKEEPIIEDDPLSSEQISSEVIPKEQPFFEENSFVTVKEEPMVENDAGVLKSPAAESPLSTGSGVLFDCEECGKRFSRANLYRNHLQKHENIRSGKFQCDICQQCLGGKRDLSDHKRDTHAPVPKWMQNCPECGRGFANANSYRCHMMRHKVIRSGKFRCAACGKCVLDQKQLMQHKCPVERKKK